MGKLLLLFIVVPLIDLVLLTRVGEFIGWVNTVALVVATGFLGAWLFRWQGARAWQQWQRSLASGQLPEDGVLGGILLLLGGALLITPGIITDVIGLTLLLPASRHVASRLLSAALARHLAQREERGAGVHFVHFQGEAVHAHSQSCERGNVGPGLFRGPEGPAQGRVRQGRARRPSARPREIVDVDFEVTDITDRRNER